MNIDRHTFFTSLGFLAVILHGTPKDKQSQRAHDIAKLMEEFCAAPVQQTHAVQTEQQP